MLPKVTYFLLYIGTERYCKVAEKAFVQVDKWAALVSPKGADVAGQSGSNGFPLKWGPKGY